MVVMVDVAAERCGERERGGFGGGMWVVFAWWGEICSDVELESRLRGLRKSGMAGGGLEDEVINMEKLEMLFGGPLYRPVPEGII